MKTSGPELREHQSQAGPEGPAFSTPRQRNKARPASPACSYRLVPHRCGHAKRCDSASSGKRRGTALDGATPTSQYELSLREYQCNVGDPEYPGHYETRRVGSNGYMKFGLAQVFVSQAQSNRLVGLVEVDDGVWQLLFSQIELGTYDERSMQLKQTGGSKRANSQGKKYQERVSPMRPAVQTKEPDPLTAPIESGRRDRLPLGFDSGCV